MTSYWGRLAGSVSFVVGMILFQLRVSDDPTVQIVGITITVVVTFAAICSFYSLRSADAQARRAQIDILPGVSWVADVTIDSGTLDLLRKISSDDGTDLPAARNYALVLTAHSMQLWRSAADSRPAADVPFSQFANAEEFPLAGTAAGAAEFWLNLADGQTLTLGLVSPFLWGGYPATPKQVTRVVDAISAALVDDNAPAS